MSADPRIEAAKEAVYEPLREVAYTCSRSWEAWHYGTMTDEDFAPAWEDDTLMGEIAESVLAAADKASMIAERFALNDVPVGTIVRSAAGTVAARFDGEAGVVFGVAGSFPWGNLSLPARVLEWGQP